MGIILIIISLIAATWFLVCFILSSQNAKSQKQKFEDSTSYLTKEIGILRDKVAKRTEIIQKKDEEIFRLRSAQTVPDFDSLSQTINKIKADKEIERNLRDRAMEMAIKSFPSAMYSDEGITDRANEIYKFLKSEK